MIEAGYSERDFVVEVVASGAVGITGLSGCTETLCGSLWIDCLALRSPSVVRVKEALRIAFDPGQGARWSKPSVWRPKPSKLKLYKQSTVRPNI